MDMREKVVPESSRLFRGFLGLQTSKHNSFCIGVILGLMENNMETTI